MEWLNYVTVLTMLHQRNCIENPSHQNKTLLLNVSDNCEYVIVQYVSTSRQITSICHLEVKGSAMVFSPAVG